MNTSSNPDRALGSPKPSASPHKASKLQRFRDRFGSGKTFFNLGLFQFLVFLRRGVFYTFMVNYIFLLMGPVVTLTALLGTFDMVASVLGQNLLWGRICDRRKNRTTLIVSGETIAAFAYLAVYLIHLQLIQSGTSFLAGASIIVGLSSLEFFWSMSDVGWAALLTDVTTPEIRGRTIGALNFISSVGRMVGILYAGYLYAEGAGFRNGTIFFVVIILLLIGAGVMALTSRHTKTQIQVNNSTAASTQPDPPATPMDENGYKLNKRKYLWLLLSLAVIVVGASCINQVFLLFLELKEGLYAIGPEKGWILTSYTIGAMISSLAAGRMADKIGRSKTMVMGLGFAILTPALYGVALTLPSMLIVYALNGLSFWTIQTTGLAMAGDIIPREGRGKMLSRYNAVMSLGWGIAGLLIGGPLADVQVKLLGFSSFSAYVNAFYVSSAIIALGTLLFVIKVARVKNQQSLN